MIANDLFELLYRPKSLFICQKEAFAFYGQGNVLNWRANGQIKARQRGRKIEYKVTDLDSLGEKRNIIIKQKKK